jgi:hypothetical protein
MSFREKSAWITLVTFLVCFGVYYGLTLTGVVHGWAALHVLVICVLTLVVLQIVLHILAALPAPKDARAPRDERERLIQWRSHTLGYYVLIVLTLGLFIVGHTGHGVGDLMNYALFEVALSVVAVAAAQIVMFRRGA